MGYFFVPCPLGSLRRVPGDVFGHAELIETFNRNIFSGSKTRLFPPWGYGQFCQKWPNFAQFWKILKFAFFTRLSPFGPQGVENITWESFLSTNNALRKFFRFDLKVQKVTLSFVGYFFVPCPLGSLKRVPGDVFGHAELIETFNRNIFSGSKTRLFPPWGYGQFCQKWPNFAQFWKILKFAFFTRLSPFGPQGVENITWESFLSTNNALRKFFRFDLKVQKSDFILCGLFLCPLSLGKPKTCPRGCFRTRWIDWDL